MLLPHNLLLADSTSMSLAAAEEDERQGVEALSCAFGVAQKEVKQILEAGAADFRPVLARRRRAMCSHGTSLARS